MSNHTVAFAGSGEVKEATVKSLLNDFFDYGAEDADGFPEPPEDEISVIFPASAVHYNDELQKVVDWTEYADLPYTAVLAKGDRDGEIETLVEDAESVKEVANVDKTIVDMLVAAQEKGDEVRLILLWSDTDEHAEILLDLADTSGIKTLDLTDGLDDLVFADPETEPPAPEPEPEPEPEERPRRGRRGRKSEPEPEPEERPRRGRRGRREETMEDEGEKPLTDDEDEPQEPAEKPAEPEPVAEEPAPRRRGRARSVEPEATKIEESPEPVTEPLTLRSEANEVSWSDGGAPTSTLDGEYLSGVLQSLYLHLRAVDEANAYKNLSDPQESPVAALAREALEHVSLGVPAAVEEPTTSPRRRSGKTVGYLRNEDGVFRKAPRGKPRKGETKVDLTEDEVADLRRQGLIVEED